MSKFIKLLTRSNGDIHVNPAQVSSVTTNGNWTVLHMAGHNLGVSVKSSIDEVVKLLGEGNKSVQDINVELYADGMDAQDIADLLVPKIKEKLFDDEDKKATEKPATKPENKPVSKPKATAKPKTAKSVKDK